MCSLYFYFKSGKREGFSFLSYNRGQHPHDSQHGTVFSVTKMQIHTTQKADQENISYLFTVQSRYNQICFALFPLVFFLLFCFPFFSIHANKQLLIKMKVTICCRCTACAGNLSALQLALHILESMTVDSASKPAYVYGTWPRRCTTVLMICWSGFPNHYGYTSSILTAVVNKNSPQTHP